MSLSSAYSPVLSIPVPAAPATGKPVDARSFTPLAPKKFALVGAAGDKVQIYGSPTGAPGTFQPVPGLVLAGPRSERTVSDPANFFYQAQRQTGTGSVSASVAGRSNAVAAYAEVKRLVAADLPHAAQAGQCLSFDPAVVSGTVNLPQSEPSVYAQPVTVKTGGTTTVTVNPAPGQSINGVPGAVVLDPAVVAEATFLPDGGGNWLASYAPVVSSLVPFADLAQSSPNHTLAGGQVVVSTGITVRATTKPFAVRNKPDPVAANWGTLSIGTVVQGPPGTGSVQILSSNPADTSSVDLQLIG